MRSSVASFHRLQNSCVEEVNGGVRYHSIPDNM
jgi:hypothetical protein